MNNFFLFFLFLTNIYFLFIFPKYIINKNKSVNLISNNNNLKERKFLNKFKNLEEKSVELNDDIIILFTNDIHCAIMNDIGYDGLYLYKKELKKKYKTVLTVDSGDALQGGSIGILSKGMDIVKIMNIIGYDVANLGNHEFDFGMEQLKNISQILNCGYISSNFCFNKNKTSIFPPYKIIEVNSGIKLAFIGVNTPQTFSKTFLHSALDSDGKSTYDFLAKNEEKELFEIIQKYINEVKLKGVSYVIILSHFGNIEDSLIKYTTKYLISNLEGIDLILDGHTHLIYNSFSEDKNGKLIPIIQTGAKFSSIGMIKIKNNGTIISEIITEIPEPEDKERAEYINRGSKRRWIDLDMNQILKGILSQYNILLTEKIGFVNFDMLINNSGSSECPLCNFIADSFKYVGNADCSLINSGSVRNNLIKGEIIYDNILNTLPFNDEIIIKNIKGIDILDALEFGSKNLPFNNPRFPQVSGITFEVNTNIQSTVEVDDNELFVRVKGKRRVTDVMINGEKLILDKKYKLALNEFISKGGDGYSMFAKYGLGYNPLIIDTEAVIIYMQEVFNGTIPEHYKINQGRIIIDSKEEFDIFYHNLYKY